VLTICIFDSQFIAAFECAPHCFGPHYAKRRKLNQGVFIAICGGN
jgi:hypothetical protein